jgi:hypothetical protein
VVTVVVRVAPELSGSVVVEVPLCSPEKVVSPFSENDELFFVHVSSLILLIVLLLPVV